MTATERKAQKEAEKATKAAEAAAAAEEERQKFLRDAAAIVLQHPEGAPEAIPIKANVAKAHAGCRG